MDSNEVYAELYRRLRFSNKDTKRLETLKQDFGELVMRYLSKYPQFSQYKYIGSSETGTMSKWGTDIDCLLAFSPFDKPSFREGISSMSSHLKNINFRENLTIVPDIATAEYKGTTLGLTGVNYGIAPEEGLEGDVWMHPEYSRQILSEDQKKEVILAKAFFRTLGIPGRSLGGGFTIEQMIASFGSFENMLSVFSQGNPIYIDSSGNYKGPKSRLVVSYPFCGLENLARKFSDEEFERASNYAEKVLGDPEMFLWDAITKFNEYFWERRGSKLGSVEEYSGPDTHLYKKENKEIRRILKKLNPEVVLDLGCGNGFSTSEICSGLEGRVIGIDRNPEAIVNAQELTSSKNNFQFIAASMENIPLDDNSIDTVYMKRSLCNLPSIKMQEDALNKCYRILKEDGTLLISDLIQEGYDKLTKIRRSLGLPKLRQPNHIRLPSEREITEMTQSKFELEEIRDVTSTYYFATRIVYPFLTKMLGGSQENLQFDSLLHKVSAALPSFGSIGANKLYLLRKNGK